MLDQAFEALKTFNWGDDPKMLQPIDQAIVDTHSDNDKRAAIESRLVELLGNDISRDAKDYICRKLMLVGTEKSVPALAALLPQPENSHMACFALERIPAAEAGTAMRDALSTLKGPLQVGVIASLGARRDLSSVEPLAALLNNNDASIAGAAALALGDIHTVQAAKALTSSNPSSEARATIVDASLACAEGLLADGNESAALAVYQKLSGSNQPKHIQLAALRGKLMCAGV